MAPFFTDSSMIDGLVAILGMLGVLYMGISSIVSSPPPRSAPGTDLKEGRASRIFTRRELWNR